MHNKKIYLGLAAAAALLSQAALAASACAPAAIDKGGAAFAGECAMCHAVQADVQGMMGPNLAGVVGRASGSLPGFSYSQAMKSKAQPWDAPGIAAFIAQPQATVPGTYMPYAGMADAASRDAVACFLSKQS